MAIRLDQVYPAQVDVTSDPTGYPHGKPRNVGVAGDGTGFPLEEQWTSDLHGFLQALIDAAGITPSDTPDKVGASDYLDALRTILVRNGGTSTPATQVVIAGAGLEVAGAGLSVIGPFVYEVVPIAPLMAYAQYSIGGTGIALNGKFTLASAFDEFGLYTLASDEVELPVGWYRVSVVGAFKSDSTSDPQQVAIKIRRGSSDYSSISQYRFSATATHEVSLATEALVEITTPSTQKINVVAGVSGGVTPGGSPSTSPTLIIQRLHAAF